MAEWFETFFSGLYADVLPNVFPPEATERQARTLRRLLGLRRGMRALDVPCGQGRLTIPLARSGIEMTGVDLCEKYVRAAHRRAKRENVTARFLRDDMRRIDFDAEFHAALNWFGSFGYFADEENVDVLRRLFRALRPGGRLVIEGVNRAWIVPRFQPRGETESGGVRVVQDRHWDEAGRMVGEWTLTKGRRRERHCISLRLYNGTEIRALLRKAGFRDIRLIDLRGGRYTRHSPRWTAVARRPRQPRPSATARGSWG